MYFLLFWLLHDSLSDEIGYKTATFAGCEHSYQAPNRHREREKKRITPISALLHRLPEIDLLITNKAVHGFAPDTFHFFVHVLMNVAVLSSRLRSKREGAFAVGAPEAYILPFISFETCFCKLAFCLLLWSIFLIVFWSTAAHI